MGCRTAFLVATLIATSASVASADRYPRVYGPTGRPYGPTVAGYQYQRQYGQQWHGYRGGVAPPGYGNFTFSAGPRFGFSFGYGPWYPYGYGYDPWYGGGYYPPFVGNFYTPPVYANPPLYYSYPRSTISAPNPYDNSVIQEGLRENAERWDQPLRVPPVARTERSQTPSSPEAIIRSQRKQEYGDNWLKKIDYTNALSNYRAAVLITPDRAEPKFRLGFVLTALGQYPEAVEQFKRGLEIDPTWPSSGMSIDQLIGPEQAIEKSVIQNRLAEWVRQDVRDPNRLFLMGVILHLDRHDQARLFFETAFRLAGQGDHLAAFLQPVPPVANDAKVPDANPQAPGEKSRPNASDFPPPPPLPLPELDPAQTKPATPTVIPQKPVKPQALPQPPVPKSTPKDSSKKPGTDDAPPKPDSELKNNETDEPPAKPLPEANAPAAPSDSQPAAAGKDESDSGPQLVPPG